MSEDYHERIADMAKGMKRMEEVAYAVAAGIIKTSRHRDILLDMHDCLGDLYEDTQREEEVRVG